MARYKRSSHNWMEISLIVLGLMCLTVCSKLDTEEPAVDEQFELRFLNLTDFSQKLLAASSINPELVRFSRDLLGETPARVANLSRTSLEHSSELKKFWNNQCRKDLAYTLSSRKKPWAQQLLDAFGKPQSGLLLGTVKWVGNYDECLKVSAPAYGDQSKGFHGRYAWLTFQTQSASSLLASLTIGACFPSSCAEDRNFESLELSIFRILDQIPFVKKIVQKLPYVRATFVPEKNPLSAAAIVCICICAIFTTLVLLGTLVDAVRRLKASKDRRTTPNSWPATKSAEIINCVDGNHSKDDTILVADCAKEIPPPICPGQEFLLCFSAITNAEAIFNTSTGKEQLECLHGIRFLSMAWVILGHTYFMGANEMSNLVDILKVFDTWPFQVIMEATYSVDTFFLLSGCLLTYLFLKTEHQFKGVKHWINFYVHRYVRLTPVYAMMMFIFATWWNNLSNGPFWTVENSEKCSKYWWWNILYINNFVGINDSCMGWSWYLANDMQFYVISPLFLLAFKRDRIVGLVVVGVLLVASWITTGVISTVNSYEILFESLKDTKDIAASQAKQWVLFDEVYDKPYTRIGPYLIGVFLGYALHELKGSKNFLNKWLVIAGWVGSQVLSLSLLYGLFRAHLGPATDSAHNTLARSAWGVSVAWVLFACLTGHGGPVNKLLSWKMWIPLSRLTYCAYLVHPMVMYWFFNSLKTTLYFTNSLIVIHYLSFIVLAYGVAFVASLVFEAPIMKLEKFLKKV